MWIPRHVFWPKEDIENELLDSFLMSPQKPFLGSHNKSIEVDIWDETQAASPTSLKWQNFFFNHAEN